MKFTSPDREVFDFAEKLNRVVLNTNKGLLLIPVQQIIRIQSSSNYSKVYLTSGKTLVISKLLGWFEKHPQLQSFIRIHRAHLVNINYVFNYRKGKKGVLLLDNGETLSVSRRKKADLSNRFDLLYNS